jgi:heme oxygenase
MLADQLKALTLSSHQQLEKMLILQMKSITSKQDYINLLQLFFGFFGGLEHQTDHLIDTALITDHHLRRKTKAIADDIIALGGTPERLASDTDLPNIENKLQALGALYVIEGSTLGGKIISKMISRQLEIIDGKGLSFFNGYGSDTETMWATFKEALNNHPANIQEENVVVAAADQTFIKFKMWIENNG